MALISGIKTILLAPVTAVQQVRDARFSAAEESLLARARTVAPTYLRHTPLPAHMQVCRGIFTACRGGRRY